MSTFKTAAFQESEKTLAAYAKALAHPARVAILQMLSKKKICICGDIVVELPLSQSTVSQHLKELKSAGLISGEVNGACVCYYLNVDQVEKVRSLFQQFLSELTGEQ